MASGGMSNLDLLQMISEISWAENDNAEIFQKVASMRVGYEVYQRLSGQRAVEQLRQQTIADIAKYVQQHPNAKKEDLQKVIAKYILEFAHKIETL